MVLCWSRLNCSGSTGSRGLDASIRWNGVPTRGHGHGRHGICRQAHGLLGFPASAGASHGALFDMQGGPGPRWNSVLAGRGSAYFDPAEPPCRGRSKGDDEKRSYRDFQNDKRARSGQESVVRYQLGSGIDDHVATPLDRPNTLPFTAERRMSLSQIVLDSSPRPAGPERVTAGVLTAAPS